MTHVLVEVGNNTKIVVAKHFFQSTRFPARKGQKRLHRVPYCLIIHGSDRLIWGHIDSLHLVQRAGCTPRVNATECGRKVMSCSESSPNYHEFAMNLIINVNRILSRFYFRFSPDFSAKPNPLNFTPNYF